MSSVLEQDIRVVGRRLLDLAREEESKLVKDHRWENTVLDWCMAHQELKIRVFRFIDVFPQLSSAGSVLNHIREYFPQTEDRIPLAIRKGMYFTYPAILTKSAVHALTRSMFLKIARLFVAATDEVEALRVLQDLDRQGVLSSIDLLGEKTFSEKDAEDYFHRYAALIREFGKRKLGVHKANVSVKLSALDPNFDPIDSEKTSERVRRRFRELVRLAQRDHVFVHVDMEEYCYRDLTLRIVRDLLEEDEFLAGVDMGIVLQSYLKDAEKCLDDIMPWVNRLPRPLTIRLVRGAYWDQEVMRAQEYQWDFPVFTTKAETDVMFEKLCERILCETPSVRLAIATHNIRSIAYTVALASARKIPQQNYEFQLLYGMGTALMRALSAMDYTPRMYMPIGDPVWGMAYLVRRLLENVSSQSFVRRGIHERTDPNLLLAPPVPSSEPGRSRPMDTGLFTECSLLPFHEIELCNRFRETLQQVRSKLGQTLSCMINGKSPSAMARHNVLSPIDNQTVVAEVSFAEHHQVQEALSCADQYLSKWANRSVKDRARCLMNAAVWMEERRFELAALEVYEVGKPWREADADVKEAIDFLRFYARVAELHFDRQVTVRLPHEDNFLSFRARGVAAVIAPWNFPIAILTGMSAAALVMGNPVIMKPAEQSMLCASKVFEAFIHGGVPGGVLQLILGRGEKVGPLLVSDPRVAVIAFTGSKSVGLEIMQLAYALQKRQSFVKKLILEMGGKNAAIVDETADFDQTIPAVLHSAFGFAGQKCSALSRLIVLDSIYEKFIERLVEAAKSFVFGDPLDPLTQCGPVIDPEAYVRIMGAIDQGRKNGQLLFQADVPAHLQGHYVPPTILADLPVDSGLLFDEIFGPVLAVIRVSTFDEAIVRANETDFALTGGLFSRTPSHLDRVRCELEVGNLYINRSITGAVVGRQPFGGYGMSGTGAKAGGESYLREFAIERTISENISRHGFAPLDFGE